jgi:peptidyl-prolyl cis-trans isomerase B (cyclophilin B)
MRSLSNGKALVVLLTLALGVLISQAALATDPQFVRFETEQGNILMVMYPELAPNHVNNFTHLSRTGFYDGTRFHRIVPGFVIQGGDPNSKDSDPRNDGMGGPTLADILGPEEEALVAELNAKLEAKGYAPIQAAARLKAEFSSTVHHLRGSLSMARSRDVDSAGSQFFICVDKTSQLDGQYTVFGHVVMGMDVADIIVKAEKNPAAGPDAPAIPVAITKAVVIDGVDGLSAEEKSAWENMPEGLRNVR